MKVPNLDSKRLKRLEYTNRFTVEPLSSFKYPDNLLCNHCARDKCKFKRYAERHRDTLELRVTNCADFIPALGFSVLSGLHLSEWNTIRVGNAWSNRLQVGQQAAIFDTKNNQFVKFASVTGIHSGNILDMVDQHALHNHAVAAEITSGRTNEQDANVRMMRILKNAYGTNIASPDRDASVIYFGEHDDAS